MRITVHKASRIDDQLVEDLMIFASEGFPAVSDLSYGTILHREEGKKLFDGLVGSLPGGTIDWLLILLLEHRASLLRVLHHLPEGNDHANRT